MNSFGRNVANDDRRKDLAEDSWDEDQADEHSFENDDNEGDHHYEGPVNDPSSDEWGNSLNGSFDSDDPDEEENRGRAEQQYDQSGDRFGSRSAQFEEYSRDRRRERRTDGPANGTTNGVRSANEASRTVRVFGWSDDETSENETADDAGSEANSQANPPSAVEAVRYLKNSESVFERVFELADGENFTPLIRRLTDQLPKLSCKNGRTEIGESEKVCYSRLLYDNSVCLNIVFADSFEQCARKLFFTLKLQFAKKK